MSAPEAKKGNGAAPSANAITLVIALNPDTGDIIAQGPFDNKPLCYEMLCRAAAVVTAWKPKPKSGLIPHVDALALKGLKGN